MVIVEADIRNLEKWSDPLVAVQLDQFKSTFEQLCGLGPTVYGTNVGEAHDLALRLCDGSRQLVYRMHRVTREQISSVIESLDRAAAVIAGLSFAEDGTQSQLIRSYGLHIASRSEFLRKFLR